MKKLVILLLVFASLMLTACQNQGRDVRRALIESEWTEDEVTFTTQVDTLGTFVYNPYSKVLIHQHREESADINRYYYIEVDFATGLYEIDINISEPGEPFRRESHDGFLYENDVCLEHDSFDEETCFPAVLLDTIDFFETVLDKAELDITDLYDPDIAVTTENAFKN